MVVDKSMYVHMYFHLFFFFFGRIMNCELRIMNHQKLGLGLGLGLTCFVGRVRDICTSFIEEWG